MKLSATGEKALHGHEAFREHAYPDPYSDLCKKFKSNLFGFRPFSSIVIPDEYKGLSGAPWTIGWGFTEGVKPDDHMTRAEGDARFRSTILQYEDAVEKALTVQPNQNQFDAMVSLAYNIGTSAFARSTVVKAHNRGDFQSAARAFGLFNKSKGVTSNGLTARRAAESVLYLTPTTNSFMAPVPDRHEMPQEVDAETSLVSSPINKASVIAGASSLAAAVDQVSQVKYSVDSLGAWLVPVLCVAVACLCGYIIYTRYKQRKLGWV
jgi:lysozyme